jgi:small-conductance mechanosensitive channel
VLDFIITDSEAERLLLNRKAAVILGVASVLSACAIVMLRFSNLNLAAMSPAERERVSWLGALLAPGVACLLAGMLLFWLKCDASSRLSRTIWFVLVFVGMGFGTQIAYYAIVYLPTVRKKLSNHGNAMNGSSSRLVSSRSVAVTAASSKRQKLFGPFGWALIIGWCLLFLFVAACFTLPKIMPHLPRPIAAFFVLWPASLILGSMIYAVILFFRAGMRRTPTPRN